MTRDFTPLYSRLTVEPVSIAVEGVNVPTRGLVAIELAQPKPRFAVIHEAGDSFEIVGLFDTEDEATTTCKALAAELERVAAAQAGARLQ